MMASIWFSFRYLDRNRTEGFIHRHRASGMNRLPLAQRLRFSFHEDFSFPSLMKPALTLSFFFIPMNLLYLVYGSNIKKKKTSVKRETNFSNDSS